MFVLLIQAMSCETIVKILDKDKRPFCDLQTRMAVQDEQGLDLGGGRGGEGSKGTQRHTEPVLQEQPT